MSMVELKIDDRECLRVLDKIARKGVDASSLMAEIEGDMLEAVAANFRQQGRPDKWAKLKPSTMRARKAKGHEGAPILQVKGILLKSIQGKSTSNSATVGTNDKRAKLLHFGGTVQHKARTHTLHYKMTTHKSGRVEVGNRFAKKKNSNFTQTVQGKAYQVKIAGRPFMTMEGSDLERIKRHGMAFLQDL